MSTKKKPVTTISRSDYLKLMGLQAIADRHNRALSDILETAEAITKESEFGHTGDMIYGSRGVDEMLRLLKITVRQPAKPKSKRAKP